MSSRPYIQFSLSPSLSPEHCRYLQVNVDHLNTWQGSDLKSNSTQAQSYPHQSLQITAKGMWITASICEYLNQAAKVLEYLLLDFTFSESRLCKLHIVMNSNGLYLNLNNLISVIYKGNWMKYLTLNVLERFGLDKNTCRVEYCRSLQNDMWITIADQQRSDRRNK